MSRKAIATPLYILLCHFRIIRAGNIGEIWEIFVQIFGHPSISSSYNADRAHRAMTNSFHIDGSI